ncbi:4-hydroxybenzoate octaprenyltransferase [Pelagibacteraceae bacterium]|nr:4-hydroxybenzoate octaprenyltransferase [Pelagibacteraceae bacterium]
MKQLKNFIELTRLNKPIGYMLLFWPCSWGLALGYHYNQNLDKFLYFLFLFLAGSVLMRSAGCIVNDIVDRNIDKKIKRTRKRPLASGQVSLKVAFLYVVLLCFLAFIILIQFNNLTIFLGLGSMLLAFTYPFMKRITYWPQLFLGLTFNWGIIMAWASMHNSISLEVLMLYISAIFWTLGYDTIYGAQDIVDDEIIGVKSTSIKFKSSIKLFVSVCFLISSIILIVIIFDKMFLKSIFLLFSLFVISLIYQIVIFNKLKSETCLKAFKINNFSGMFLFLTLLQGSNFWNLIWN